MPRRRKLQATIDGKKYNVESWKTQQPGRLLREEWTEGWTGGMGQGRLTSRSPRNRYHFSENMDCSTHPYMRLRPRSIIDDLDVSNLRPQTFPVYTFIAEDSANEAYLYILNGQRAHKIKISDGTLVTAKNFGNNAVCGRPALFNGVWYVPLGNSVDYQSLDTISTAGSDTWSAAASGQKALHFTTLVDETVAKIVRAETDSEVSIASDPTSAASWGDSFGVGETTAEIVDLHTWRGEILIVRQDSVYRSDVQGNAHAIQTFVGSTITPDFAYHGANSFVHGAYFYWPHISGLWRFTGSTVADNIGFDSALDYTSPAQQESSLAFSEPISWTSFAAYGRWAYAFAITAETLMLMYGRIGNDGSVLWHGKLWEQTAGDTSARVAITDDGGPMLWVFGNQHLTRILLAADGSPRTRTDDVKDRGEASATFYTYLPQVDFGDRTRQKQLRRFAVMLEGWDQQATLELKVFRNTSDPRVPERVGAAIAIEGSDFVERNWTPGTNDLAYYITPYVKITTSAGYNPTTADPRIAAIYIEAASPEIISVTISLMPDDMIAGTSVASAKQALLNLLNKGAVAVSEPVAPKDSFTGYIDAVSSEAILDEGKKDGWRVTLTLLRYDYGF